jgi:hypothetical protein
MALTNYTTLQASIADWLMRSDMTAVIPDMIRLAEAEIERKLRVRQMLVRAVTIPAADEPYENLPGDFLELKAIQFNSNPITVPKYRTPAWLRAYRRSSQNETGTPVFYTIEGTQFLFDRTPSDVELEILYYQQIPPLATADGGVNWLLTDYPDIYLFGALTYAAPYVKEDERIATWDALFQRAIRDLESADKRAEINGAPIVVTARKSIG